MLPEIIENKLQRILLQVQKPGRYIGGELNQILKDWDKAAVRIALAFPDIYDLGMSNLGLAILYDILNQQPDVLAERVYAPWHDMESMMRRDGIPLYSLESKHPIAQFDILGFTLPYETLYTNTLNMLDLASIPIFGAERAQTDPLVIAGGHACFNPEPMAGFIDAFVIGEGEEVILEIIDCVRDWKSSMAPRRLLLKSLAGIEGVYVPSLYEVYYQSDGTLSHLEPLVDEAPLPIQKRIVAKLPPPPAHFIVPFIDIAHNRIPVEIMRGCTRGCRFCHAGMVTRPVRERKVEEVITAIANAVDLTGFEAVGLLSLSSSDYSHILELIEKLRDQFESQELDLSLPSLRVESFSVDLMDLLQAGSRRGGFTLAPEAATERMRAIINKPLSTQQLLETSREIFKRGWHTLKLYFMIGLPSETEEEILAIAELSKRIFAEGRSLIGKRFKIHVSVGTFVPKPHTPFQWASCDSMAQIQNKQALLKQQLRAKNIKLSWTDPRETMLETWLSRGDRRLADVIYYAWQNGAKFDAWEEHFLFERWLEAFGELGLDPFFYTHRERSLEETFPWDHINTGVDKRFLAEDYQWSLEGRTREDCRRHCYACGILTTFAAQRHGNRDEVWGCPQRKGSRKRDGRIQGVVPGKA